MAWPGNDLADNACDQSPGHAELAAGARLVDGMIRCACHGIGHGDMAATSAQSRTFVSKILSLLHLNCCCYYYCYC
jgi:hypothetical protein